MEPLSPNPGLIASGQVNVTARANDVAGAYTIQARARGAAAVSFGLTNIWRLYLPFTAR